MAESYHQRVKNEKRQAAVEAAMEVFLEQGYERASLQQIAARADVSTATLFKRFPTKASLFEAIVVEFWVSEGATRGEALTVGDPKAGLRRVGAEFAARLRHPRMVGVYRVLIAEAQRFPELGRMLTERGKQPFLDRVSGYVKAEAKAGNLKAPDAVRVARQFLAMISDQLFWPAMLRADFSVSDRDAKLAVEEAVLTVLARYGTARRRNAS